jgi:hypothetical protein
MAKHKSITNLPTPSPAPPSSPRLAAQLLVVKGELVVVGACVLGFTMATSWLITGSDLRGKERPFLHRPRRGRAGSTDTASTVTTRRLGAILRGTAIKLEENKNAISERKHCETAR